jgi:predicted DCC family thiol-disulfide oxidoreductase YuxK
MTLIFDGYCGFCTRSVRQIRSLDRHNRITATPYQQPGAIAAQGLSLAECETAAWAVTPDGTRYAGAGAINLALSVALGTSLPIRFYLLPGVRQAQDYVYSWIARNRRLFRGDTPYCAQKTDVCR